MQGCTGEGLHGGGGCTGDCMHAGLYKRGPACGGEAVQERACVQGGAAEGRAHMWGWLCRKRPTCRGGAVQGGICMHNSGIAPTQPEHTHHTAD